jgi:hypothetical protein
MNVPVPRLLYQQPLIRYAFVLSSFYLTALFHCILQLEYDILQYIVIERLAQGGRAKLKDDGLNLSDWLQCLASFWGHLYVPLDLAVILFWYSTCEHVILLCCTLLLFVSTLHLWVSLFSFGIYNCCALIVNGKVYPATEPVLVQFIFAGAKSIMLWS